MIYTGDFQGPALVAIFEGACLSREEISNLQFLPPWRLRGNTINYGLGLVGCYSICHLLSIISGGYFYMFDPRGLVLAAPSSSSPSAKMFSLIGMHIPPHLNLFKLVSSIFLFNLLFNV